MPLKKGAVCQEPWKMSWEMCWKRPEMVKAGLSLTWLVSPGSAWVRFPGWGVYKTGNLNIEVLFTPGHTAGGVSYKIHDSVFSGDTIFAGSMGRANSSWSGLHDAITKRLLTLPDHTRLFPGHGPATTVGEEKRHNPFFSHH